MELSPCSKGGQGEGEAAVIAHQPVSQGIEPGTTESVDREESPEPPASRISDGVKFEQPTFSCNISFNVSDGTSRSYLDHSQEPCEWVDADLWIVLGLGLGLLSRLY